MPGHIRINGRMEIVHLKRCTVLVDYAHNAVSMESLLGTATITPNAWSACSAAAETAPGPPVFHGGGDRRQDNGPVYSADNSHMKPEEHHRGYRSASKEDRREFWVRSPDRLGHPDTTYRENARPGDMIAIIGKGHEDQEMSAACATHFLNREVIEGDRWAENWERA